MNNFNNTVSLDASWEFMRGTPVMGTHVYCMYQGYFYGQWVYYHNDIRMCFEI